MGLNFPSSPAINDLYPVPAVAGIPQYKWDGTVWLAISASGAAGGGPASGITVTPVGGVAATNVQAAIAELDSEKVAKAGDTMTGDLTISKDAPAITLDKTATTSGQIFW
jgi:hypothetical protein